MLPRHIAIIPDGNRRWGKKHGVGANVGHKKGAENFRKISHEILSRGVPQITFWAASEDNLLKRSRVEISFLSCLLAKEIASPEFVDEMTKCRVSVRFIGAWKAILHNKKLDDAIRTVEQRTAGFKKYHLTVLFGYDGRREMLDAVRRVAKTSNEKIDHEMLRDALWTGSLLPVDLVVRTGEEDVGWSHWSAGFMMWQTAQSEFYTTKTLWPDFSSIELERMLDDYARRERRFGK